MGMSLKGGKIIPRELTEEEKEEAEAATKAKGKAPPPKAKKGQEEEEPTPEEIEKMEKEKAEKEEIERKKQAEWEALDEETKFFRANEDPFKEPSIKFQIEVEDKHEENEKSVHHEDLQAQPNDAKNEEEAQVPKIHLEDASVSQTKMAEELIELEESIKDLNG
jgi:hypothetical protein